jgi:uncharacterized membrane protein
MDSTTSSTRRRAKATITSALAAAMLATLIVATPTHAAGTPRPPADPSGAFLLRDGRFTPLGGVPGATAAGHVNLDNRGQVVGFYPDDQGVLRSFIKDRRGRVTTFAVPGAAATLAAGINDRGQVAGTYLAAPLGGPPGAARGFVRQPNGRITTLDIGAVTDINNRGQVVGQKLDAAGRAIGFLRDPDGKMTIIDLPGRAEVGEVLALNDRGQVVGLWEDRAETPTVEPGTHHGFLLDRGRLTRFDVPGSLATGALGINNAGQVTGAYDDASGRHHGFVLRRGRYTTIDAPGRTGTDAWGVNDRGDVVIPDRGTGLAPVTLP